MKKQSDEIKWNLIVTALLVLLFMTIGVVFGICSVNQEGELGVAATRPHVENQGIVIIDEEQTALADDFSATNEENLILLEINEQRRAAGLGELTMGSNLGVAARIRATELPQYFSHTRPDGSEWWTVNEACCFGENLSQGYSASQVTSAWMDSPAHKEVMMTPEYRTIGIGVYKDSVSGKTFIAAEFGY